MIVRQYNEVIYRDKILTQRIKRETDEAIQRDGRISAVVNAHTYRKRFYVGKNEAIVPKRGKRSVWFYRIGPEHVTIYDKHDAVGNPIPKKLQNPALVSDDDLRADDWRQLRMTTLAISERPLQEMTGLDAVLEGIPCVVCGLRGHNSSQLRATGCPHEPAIVHYRDLWNDINRSPGTTWEDNPIVYRIEFNGLAG